MDSAGQPRLGAMASKVVKESGPLFAMSLSTERRRPRLGPLTSSSLGVKAKQSSRSWTELGRMESSSPMKTRSVSASPGTLRNLSSLSGFSCLRTALMNSIAALAQVGLRNVDWTDLHQIQKLTLAIDAIGCQTAARLCQKTLTGPGGGN